MKKSILNAHTGRRRFLRGVGAAVALPYLEMFATPAQAACGVVNPRFLAIYFPNGASQDDFFTVHPGNGASKQARYNDWKANGKNKPPVIKSGGNWTPGRNMKPFVDAGLKNKIAVYQHLSCASLAGGSNGGSHPQGTSCFLTCAGAKNISPIRVRQSFDQIVADHYQDFYGLRGVHFNCGIRHYGDDHVPIGYSEHISWKADGRPENVYTSPRDAFRDYFGGTIEVNPGVASGDPAKKSMLDFVLADAQSLRNRLGMDDKLRLDDYLDGVREMEQSIENNVPDTSVMLCDVGSPNYPHYVVNNVNTGSYDRAEHIRMNLDMIYLAFRCGVTNVATLMLDHARSEFRYPFIRTHAHNASHQYPDDVNKMTEYFGKEVAAMYKKLDNLPREANGLTPLDNTVAMFGSGMNGRFNAESGFSEGHKRHSLPMMIAGSGGGVLKTDQEVGLPAATPYANLFRTLQEKVYCTPQTDFGNGNGIISSMIS